MDPYQFGTIDKCSTVHALIEICHKWFRGTDDCRKNNYVHTVLIDYSKAFNHINPNVFHRKLHHMDVPNFFLHWVMDFLSKQVGPGKSESLSQCPHPMIFGELYPKAPNWEFFSLFFRDDQ